MKSYILSTKFTFGKYRDKTLEEIIDLDPQYIDWCSINLNHFHISDEVINTIEKNKPNFSFSESALKMLKVKKQLHQNTQNESSSLKYWEKEDPFSKRNPYYDSDRDIDQQDPEFWDWMP